MQMPGQTRKKIWIRIFILVAFLLVSSGWLYFTPAGLLGKADALGYAVCHRIPERSFHVGERALPLCARCSGMFLGAVIGLAYQSVVSKRHGGIPHWSTIALLVVMAGAFVVDGSNSYLYLIKSVYPGALANIPNLYEPNNTLRLFTGMGMGLGISAALQSAFTQTAWKGWKPQPALTPLKGLGMIAIAVVAALLILTQNPIVLYPVAVVSAVGVLVLLGMVFTIVWITLMGQDNTFESVRQMWVPILAGLTVALIQVFAIDLLRFWLTGTWGGFPLG